MTDVCEYDVQAVGLLADADIENDVVCEPVGALEPEIPLSNLVDVN